MAKKSPKKIAFHLPMGASMLLREAIAPSPPLAPPLVCVLFEVVVNLVRVPFLNRLLPNWNFL